jgi:hypothetical protein
VAIGVASTTVAVAATVGTVEGVTAVVGVAVLVNGTPGAASATSTVAVFAGTGVFGAAQAAVTTIKKRRVPLSRAYHDE